MTKNYLNQNQILEFAKTRYNICLLHILQEFGCDTTSYQQSHDLTIIRDFMAEHKVARSIVKTLTYCEETFYCEGQSYKIIYDPYGCYVIKNT